MLHGLLARLEDLILAHPRRLLALAVALTVAAVWLGAGIELRTSRRDLVADSDQLQARWDRLFAEFGEPQSLVVVLHAREGEPATVADLEAVATEIAEALEHSPTIESVFYRIDTDWMLDTALFGMPAGQLVRLTEQVGELLGTGDGQVALPGIAALNERVAARIEASLSTGSALPGEGADEQAARLVDLLGAELRFLRDPEAAVRAARAFPAGARNSEPGSALTANGFLTTHDSSAVFVLVGAGGEQGELQQERALVGEVRGVAAGVVRGHPQLAFGLTGRPALTVEEMDTIARDGERTSLIAILGVSLLALATFHYRRHAVLGLLVLLAGVLWALGAVRLELGHLNMITTALIPILVGIGIDYAVHPLSQFEIERRTGASHEAAVRATFQKTSAAVATSTLTTAAAFLCFLLMHFRGFSELGLVAGVGVLLCLLSALTVLPALLVLYGRRPSANHEPGALIDRVWSTSVSEAMCRRPLLVTGVALVATVASVAAARQVRVDTSLHELMPAASESLGYLDRLERGSSLSPYFNLVVSDDPGQLEAWSEHAEQLETVAWFESALRFLPADPMAASAAAERAGDLLDRIEIPERDETSAQLASAFDRLANALEAASEEAFLIGLAPLAARLEEGRATAREAQLVAAGADAVTSERWAASGRELRHRAREIIGRLRAAARSAPPTVESLPTPLRQRFVTAEGRWVGYLYPTGDAFDPEFLARFNADSRSVSADAIGFPMLFEEHSGGITSGFVAAFAAGAVLVLLVLLADFRRLSHVLLAIVPVAVGVAWMLGLMAAFDLPFNLANLVAVPLVLGVGIDSGVHVIHRFRLEGRDGMAVALEHTGRAILIASLTTMVGFGTLALASHRGMASLGVLLFIGVGTCLVASLVLLPNLLVLLGLARR